MNTNPFVTSSKKERINLTALYEQQNVTDYWFTDVEGHDRYEGEFTFNDKTYIVEVKNRAVKSNQYSTTLIEQSKVEYLVNKAKAENKIPMLIIFFTDSKVGFFNLNNVKPEWREVKYCNKTTAVSSGKVDKSVYLIPITIDNLRDFKKAQNKTNQSK